MLIDPGRLSCQLHWLCRQQIKKTLWPHRFVPRSGPWLKQRPVRSIFLRYVYGFSSHVQSLFSLSPFSFLKMGHSRPFFFIFVFSMELHVNVHYKCLPMTGFEPETSRTGSNCSINSVTTTAPSLAYFFTLLFLISPIQLFKPFFSSSSFNTYIPLSLTLRLQL